MGKKKNYKWDKRLMLSKVKAWLLRENDFIKIWMATSVFNSAWDERESTHPKPSCSINIF